MTPSISSAHVSPPRVFGGVPMGQGSTIASGTGEEEEPLFPALSQSNQLPPNKRAARQATRDNCWTTEDTSNETTAASIFTSSQGNKHNHRVIMSSSLDQKGPSPHLLVSEPEPQLPPMTSADDVTRASSSSSSGCQLGSLLVLAEATSQFVQSSRVDGQLPGGFGQLSLQAQKLQEDIKRFMEQQQKESTVEAGGVTNSVLQTTLASSSQEFGLVTTATCANRSCVSSCTKDSYLCSLLGEQASLATSTPVVSHPTNQKICCSAQQEQRQQIQGVAPLSLDTQTLSVSSSSSSSPSVSTCSLQPPPPPHLGSLIPPSSPFGSTSSSETSSSSSTKSSYTLRPLSDFNSPPRTLSDENQVGAPEQQPIIASNVESVESSACKKGSGSFKKKHEFWSQSAAASATGLDIRSSSVARGSSLHQNSSTVSESLKAPATLQLLTSQTDSSWSAAAAVNDYSPCLNAGGGSLSWCCAPKPRLLSPLDTKGATLTSIATNSLPKYFQRISTSRSGGGGEARPTALERSQQQEKDKNCGVSGGGGVGGGSISNCNKRREERIRRLSMLLANDDTEKRRSRERLKQLRVRFVEEVQRQTEATACSFNIIHSGQFMSSQVWSGSSAGVEGQLGGQDLVQAKWEMKELAKNGYNFFPGLRHLFTYIINQAYHTHHLVSPRWKSFRGINLDVPCKVRLNNLIWRCWHLQFCKKKRHPMCRFVVPSTSPTVPEYGTHLLEGKYWRRQDSAIIAEYMSWRWFYKLKNSKKTSTSEKRRAQLSKMCEQKRLVGLQFPKQHHHNLPETHVGGTNADFIQSNLTQFHLVLPVDLLDIEPFQPKTPLNLDFLNELEKIELDLSETDTASSVSSNFFSPMQPETVEMPVSVEAVDSVNSSSCTLVCSSTDNDPEENSSCCHFGGPELDCSSSSAPLPVVSAADCAATVSSQEASTSVLTNEAALLDSLEPDHLDAGSLSHVTPGGDLYGGGASQLIDVTGSSPEDPSGIPSSLIQQAFLNPATQSPPPPHPHLQDQQGAAAGLSADQLLCSTSAAESAAASDVIDPNQLDSDSLTPVFLDSPLNNRAPSAAAVCYSSRKRPLSSVDGFDLRSEQQQHHPQHSLPRYHHVYAVPSSVPHSSPSPSASSATAVITSDCCPRVSAAAAASIHNGGANVVSSGVYSQVPLLHKSESVSNCYGVSSCCGGAEGGGSSCAVVPLRSASVSGGLGLLSSSSPSSSCSSLLHEHPLGGDPLQHLHHHHHSAQQHRRHHPPPTLSSSSSAPGPFDDDDEEVVEDESDEISESGSDSPNHAHHHHHLLNSHPHHGHLGPHSVGQQQPPPQLVVSSSAMQQQKCGGGGAASSGNNLPAPVFTSLSSLAPPVQVGVPVPGDNSPLGAAVADMSGSKNMSLTPQSQMHGPPPSMMPGHLNAMIAAYHPFSPMPNSASLMRGAGAAGGASSNSAAAAAAAAATAQFLVNGGQSTIVSSGSVVPAAFAQQPGNTQVSQQPNGGGPTSPLALIMRQHQQAVAAQQHHGLHVVHSQQNQISSHQLQSPSLPGGGGQRFGMPGGGSGSSSVSPSEAEVAAASLVNAPLLKGILAQVGSPGGGGSMTSSGGGSVGGRQSVSLPLMDKKMMDNEEMKANLYDRIDPGVIKYQRLRDKTPEELTLHRERREKVHQISERKRRHNIQVAQNILVEKLPQSGEQNKQFKTRANILSRASSYIETLEDERDRLRKDILQLREDLAKMDLELKQLHRMLPSDPSVLEERLSEQSCVVLQQQFHAYVAEQSHKEAPFFIFSHLARRFFDSFVASVKLHNFDKFSDSVLAWIHNHCNMVNIRAVVTESLTDLCVKDIPYAAAAAAANVGSSSLSAASASQMMSAAAAQQQTSSEMSSNSAAASASSITLPTSSY